MNGFAEAVQLVMLAAGGATGLVVLGKFSRGCYRFAKRLDLIHATILAELLPNGGSSIKDQIVRIDQRVAVLEANQAPGHPRPSL